MSPLPPCTLQSVELGLSKHHDLKVKEVKDVLPHRVHADSVKEIQPPQVNQQRQGELTDVQPLEKEVSPGTSFSQQKAHEKAPKNLTETQAQEVNTFSQQRQAELDEWRKFRKDHQQAPKNPLNLLTGLFGTPSSSSSLVSGGHAEPQAIKESPISEVSSFSQQKQAELDEWRKFREDHEQAPKNPLKFLTDLFDIDNTPTYKEDSTVTQSVEGISAWKKRSKRRGGGHRTYKCL